jgi:hypothetical protein
LRFANAAFFGGKIYFVEADSHARMIRRRMVAELVRPPSANSDTSTNELARLVRRFDSHPSAFARAGCCGRRTIPRFFAGLLVLPFSLTLREARSGYFLALFSPSRFPRNRCR